MHLYVSFRSRVSNGGFPHINVYLPEEKWKDRKSQAFNRLSQCSGGRRESCRDNSSNSAFHTYQRRFDTHGWTLHLHDAAQGPNVGLGAVALPVEDLWGQVVWSAADCSKKMETTPSDLTL